jgi:hypothetical protein
MGQQRVSEGHVKKEKEECYWAEGAISKLQRAV